MAELAPADHEPADRHRVFVVVVRSRLLRLRLADARRRTAWLRARAHYLVKQLPASLEGRRRSGPGRVIDIASVR